MTTLSLVQVDKNVKTTGLVKLVFSSTNPAGIAFLKKLGDLNTTWNNLVKPKIEAELSAKTGRKVILLNGNYIKQKKGVVSYHGALPIPGAVFMPRKGFDAKTNSFYLWVVIK